MTPQVLWQRFRDHYCAIPSIGLSLDISRMAFDAGFFQRMDAPMKAAFAAMDALEAGAIANPSEQRMVGHYWLRTPEKAPSAELSQEISTTIDAARQFAADVHAGNLKPPQAERFTQVLSIGIGGSALGPLFVSQALGDPASNKMQIHFIDNTDPEGIDLALRSLGDKLKETLVLVLSKSGGTPETRNGMLLVAEAYRRMSLDFAPHAVAITMPGSKLDHQAQSEGWLRRFPMYDWVGGRTSETSAVGLIPGFLQGLDMDALLAGARACDEVTRRHDVRHNPAALMALMWYHASDGRGAKDLVVLPYKDRLLLFSRCLQQLIMESLGKQLNLQGERVDQGLAVYGNKGSTDQHAYLQQLRDGVNNFFVTFIRVLESGGEWFLVEPDFTAGDYLHGFLLGTRAALHDNQRQSMTITVQRVDASTVGTLIALFERAVGFYASLIGINAYDQPGVEAGKKAAASVLAIQKKVAAGLGTHPQTSSAIATAIGEPDQTEQIFLILEHMAANGDASASTEADPGKRTFSAV